MSVAGRDRTLLPWIFLAIGGVGVVLALIGIVMLATGRSADSTDASAGSARPSATLPGDVATTDLGPLPSDIAGARGWVEANDERMDQFQRIAAELTSPASPAECGQLAERFNAELGPVSDHLAQVAASPDPVLAELLTSTTISVRTLVAACMASDGDVADRERLGLANALILIERRREQLER